MNEHITDEDWIAEQNAAAGGIDEQAWMPAF